MHRRLLRYASLIGLQNRCLRRTLTLRTDSCIVKGSVHFLCYICRDLHAATKVDKRSALEASITMADARMQRVRCKRDRYQFRCTDLCALQRYAARCYLFVDFVSVVLRSIAAFFRRNARRHEVRDSVRPCSMCFDGTKMRLGAGNSLSIPCCGFARDRRHALVQAVHLLLADSTLYVVPSASVFRHRHERGTRANRRRETPVQTASGNESSAAT